MSDLLLLLVAGVNFFGGLVIGEYVWKFLEEKNETTESLFSAENVRKFLKENPPKEEGKKAFDLLESERNSEYQRGLNDAWEAARKIVTWPDRSLVNSDTFDLDPGENIFTKYSASEAIAKLKAYEEKQNDKFEFGDEIIDLNGVKGCVVSKDNDGSSTMYALFDGCRVPQYVTQSNYRKTGKHYDIEKLLEGIKHD